MVSFQLLIASARRLLVASEFQVKVVLVIWWQRQEISAGDSSSSYAKMSNYSSEWITTQVYVNVYLNFKSSIWLDDKLPVKASASVLLSSKCTKWWNIYLECCYFFYFDSNIFIQFQVIWWHRLRQKKGNLPDCSATGGTHSGNDTMRIPELPA